jgi:hypothetical protein
MANVFKQLQALLPDPPLQIGTVTAITSGVCTLQLPGGGVAHVRGEASVNDVVFFRDQVIEGTTSSLPIEVIEI